jgi:hypothetical protein
VAWHRGCRSRAIRKDITTAYVIAGAAGGAVAIALMQHNVMRRGAWPARW